MEESGEAVRWRKIDVKPCANGLLCYCEYDIENRQVVVFDKAGRALGWFDTSEATRWDKAKEKTFPERLQLLREDKRPVKSRRITSELIGLSHDALRRYERGDREPRLTELLLIADYYEISMDELCGGLKLSNLQRKNW